MPRGKPAGTRCIHLSADNTCAIHDGLDYPPVCRNLRPDAEMCGETFEQAVAWLEKLELLTKPD